MKFSSTASGLECVRLGESRSKMDKRERQRKRKERSHRRRREEKRRWRKE